MKAKSITLQSILFFLLIAAFSLPEMLMAQTVTWLGGAEAGPSNWALEANWSGGAVPLIGNDVVIPLTANNPLVTTGTGAEAKSVNVASNASVTIESGGSLTISGAILSGIINRGIVENSGTVNIDGTGEFGIYNLGNGAFTNKSILKIGQFAGNVLGTGIYNEANFENIDGGEIRIDNVGSDGIFNSSSGSFTNEATIIIGQNGGNIHRYGVWNTNNFNNTNFGSIGISNSSGYGILNSAIFNNTDGGAINISNTGTSGIFNATSGIILNEATLNIGQNGAVNNIAVYGIWNKGYFGNAPGGIINIGNTGDFGLYNFSSSTFTNEAMLNIGQNGKNITGSGIYNESSFGNINGGVIRVDNTSSHGINNFSGSFTNEATINIGKNGGNILGQGLRNIADFENTNGGIIHIANATSSGIFNTSNFNNNSSAVITIGNVGEDGILNNSGSFTNSANIDIGQNGGINNINRLGIWNRAVFINNGTISIDNTGVDGLYNFNTGNFTNTGVFKVGQNDGNIGWSGILNYHNFDNSGSGQIWIDKVKLDAIYNVFGSTFTNTAAINIGQNGGGVSDYGIWNETAQFANNSGSINIGNTGLSGIRNKSGGSFTNAATLNISNTNQHCIWNDASTFDNNACAIINLFDDLNNNSSFNNDGLLTVNTTQPHTNTGTFTNNGILNYPQGNPIPNVINAEIIVAPTAANGCQTISPAFDLSNPLDFGIIGIFSDANAVISAGSFDENINTFIPNPALMQGVHNFFVKIGDTGGGCVRILPWQLTTQNCCPPSLLITGNSQRPSCPGGNDGTLSITIGAGQAPFVINWSNGATGPNLSNLIAGAYTVTVTGVNGCSDIAHFTVPQGIDNIKPIITCPGNITQCGAQNIIWSAPATSDNCGVNFGSLSCMPSSSSWFGVGTTVVNCSVSDVNGNTNSCSFSVTINPLPNVNITTSPVPFGCQGLGVVKANVLNANSLMPPLSYSWSNGSFDPGTIVISNGAYTVTVEDGHGCSKTASFSTNFNLYTTLSNYILISTDDSDFKESNVNGGVGVKSAGGKAKIKYNSAINGFVKAPAIYLQYSTINGKSSYPYPNNPPYGAAAVTLPAFQFNNACNNSSPNLTVNNGQTKTINSPHNAYDKIEVKEGGTLIVSANIAVLYAREIKTKNGASIIFNGNTTVKVRKDVDLDKNNSVGPSGPYTVTFWIEEEFKLEEGSSFTANVYALKKVESRGKSNSRNFMNGIFISGDKINSDYTTWNANPNCGFNVNGGQNLLALADDLLGLNATQDEQLVKLLWVTNTEYKNDHFVVERSSDGVDFTLLYEVQRQFSGSQPKQYNDVDLHPNVGPNYYRVKVFFEDGTFKFSEIKRVDFLMDPGIFNLWPNPATESITVFREKFAGKPAKIQIVNSTGQPMLRQEFDALPDGPVTFDLNNFPEGMYHFTIQVEGYRMQTRSFVVVKTD